MISVCVVLRHHQRLVDSFVRQTITLLGQHFQFFELLIIDNHSLDNSGAMIQSLQKELPNIRLIRLSRVYSFETAMTAALENCVGDYVVVMRAEYDPPALIPELIKESVAGNDIVIVRRQQKRTYSFLSRWSAGLFYRLASRILHYELSLEDTDFRAFSRRAVNSLTQIRRKRRSLKYFNAQVGFKRSYVQLEDHFPDGGPAAEPFVWGASTVAGIDLILSNSAAPLRWATYLGLGASFLNLLYVGYIIIVTLIKDEIVEGWLTTNVVSTTMFFLLFMILTILTEYITRLLEESRDEPLYFVESESHSTVSTFQEVMHKDKVNVV